jgi:6-phosphogluconolactonase
MSGATEAAHARGIETTESGYIDALCTVKAAAFAAAAARHVSSELWSAVAQRGAATIAISGGTTPLPVLALLRSMSLPWSQTTWLWVDERFVPSTDSRSNAGNALRALFSHVPNATFLPCPGPESGDLAGAARRYAGTVRDALQATGDRFDLVLLGIGDDGHTASLFPNEPEVLSNADVVLSVPARAGREPRLTLSASTLLQARCATVLAQGASKRAPIERARTRPQGPYLETPAHLLAHRVHPTFWLLDPSATPA